jgi:hypothetical protein
MARELTAAAGQQLLERLRPLPVPARRFLCVIVRQTYQGTLRSKAPGRATMPEIHEACGLDVDELQGLLTLLRDARFIALEGSYPFEEVRLEGELDDETSLWERVLNRCGVNDIPLEMVIVDLQFQRLFAP